MKTSSVGSFKFMVLSRTCQCMIVHHSLSSWDICKTSCTITNTRLGNVFCPSKFSKLHFQATSGRE